MLTCGHTFDNSSIEWFDRSCRICRYPFSRSEIKKNYAAESALEIIKKRENNSCYTIIIYVIIAWFAMSIYIFLSN